MDIEDKLNLIQQLHREHEGMERIENHYQKYENDNYNLGFKSFRLRLLLAVTFFVCFLVIEKNEYELNGIGSQEIVEYIGKTTFDKINSST